MSPPLAPEPWLRDLCPGGEAGPKIENTESLSKGADFISNSLWRCLNVRALSKTVEVMMKGHWEETGRLIGDIDRTVGQLVFWRVAEKEIPGGNPPGDRTDLNH